MSLDCEEQPSDRKIDGFADSKFYYYASDDGTVYKQYKDTQSNYVNILLKNIKLEDIKTEETKTPLTETMASSDSETKNVPTKTQVSWNNRKIIKDKYKKVKPKREHNKKKIFKQYRSGKKTKYIVHEEHDESPYMSYYEWEHCDTYGNCMCCTSDIDSYIDNMTEDEFIYRYDGYIY